MAGDARWWVVDGEREEGPYDAVSLKHLVLAGRVTPTTMLRRDGGDERTPASTLADLWAAPAEPDGSLARFRMGPTANKASIAPGAWTRFMARFIDLLLNIMIAIVIIALLAPELLNHPVMNMRVVPDLILIPMAFLIEVPILGLTGGTLGKWLFGIRVHRVDGGRLSMGDVLRRNLLLWPFGFAFGLPLVYLYTFYRAAENVGNGEPCIWDLKAGTCVTVTGGSSVRRVFGIGLFAVLFLFVRVATVIEPDVLFGISDSDVTDLAAPTQWDNPLTGGRTTIPAGWTLNGEHTEEALFWFDGPNSAVLLGHEQVEGVDLPNYVDALIASSKFGVQQDRTVTTLADGSLRVDVVFSQQFEADGDLYRLRVRLWQTSPQDYWRIVIITPQGDEESEGEAKRVALVLASTVPGSFTLPQPPPVAEP